jgi:hypothetical protein
MTGATFKGYILVVLLVESMYTSTDVRTNQFKINFYPLLNFCVFLAFHFVFVFHLIHKFLSLYIATLAYRKNVFGPKDGGITWVYYIFFWSLKFVVIK